MKKIKGQILYGFEPVDNEISFLITDEDFLNELSKKSKIELEFKVGVEDAIFECFDEDKFYQDNAEFYCEQISQFLKTKKNVSEIIFKKFNKYEIDVVYVLSDKNIEKLEKSISKSFDEYDLQNYIETFLNEEQYEAESLLVIDFIDVDCLKNKLNKVTEGFMSFKQYLKNKQRRITK